MRSLYIYIYDMAASLNEFGQRYSHCGQNLDTQHLSEQAHTLLLLDDKNHKIIHIYND